MTKHIPNKLDKQKEQQNENIEAQDAELAETIKKVDKQIHKPHVERTHWETAAPSSKVVLKRGFKDFGDAWRAAYKLLVKSVETHLTSKHPNLKLMIGIEYTVIKHAIDYEDQDPDEIRLKPITEPKTMHAQTKAVNTYNVASVSPSILNLKAELKNKIFDGIDNQAGSNWAIGRIKNLFAKTHTVKDLCGSSYIPTPEKCLIQNAA
jgi:hypothetical protein